MEPAKFFLVIINHRVVHSVHSELTTAEAWAKCKEHDGSDASVVELDRDLLDGVAGITLAD